MAARLATTSPSQFDTANSGHRTEAGGRGPADFRLWNDAHLHRGRNARNHGDWLWPVAATPFRAGNAKEPDQK